MENSCTIQAASTEQPNFKVRPESARHKPFQAPGSTCFYSGQGYSLAVKFISALIVYLLMGFLLGWGVLSAVHGKPVLLIVSFLAYAAAFGKLGCLPGKAH